MAVQLIPTEKVAELFQVKPETVRSAVSKRGHYCGLKPLKLPNRRLAWPLDEVERTLRELGAKSR